MRTDFVWTLGFLLALGMASAQSQLLLNEDFEDGLAGWSIVDAIGPPPSPLWRLAEDGECGVTKTRMAAYALPAPNCTYALGVVAGSQLLSEPFALEGHGPWTLRLDVVWGLSSATTSVSPFVRNEVTGETLAVPIGALDSVYETAHAVEAKLELGAWAGQLVRFGVGVMTEAGAGAGSGLRLDNIQLRSSAFDVVGSSLPGTQGKPPRLEGSGPLVPGSEGMLVVSDGLPKANSVLVAGREPLLLPYLGGVLVPLPQAVHAVRTDNAGMIVLPFTLPETPPGQSLWFQCWIEDPAAPGGHSATNGLKATTS